MPSTPEALGSFAGATGVGALCLLGVFLILDGRAPNLFPTVEVFAKTSTWGIVATVPVLAISYLIGLFLVAGGERLVQLVYGPGSAADHADFRQLGTLDASKSILVQQFLQLHQERAVLAGSAFALVFLAVGALSEIRNLPHLRRIIRSAAVATLLLAGALFYYAGIKSEEAHDLAQPAQVQRALSSAAAVKAR